MKLKTKFLSFLFVTMVAMSFSSCTENYSNGNRVGTLTKFSRAGLVFKSYEGHLNVTQTGMNTANGFDFSIDRDNEPENIVTLLDSAQNFGWKVEVKYHQVVGWNWFENRGSTDYFVTEVKVLDRNFSSLFSNKVEAGKVGNVSNGNTQAEKDTVFTVVLTADEARKMGILK